MANKNQTQNWRIRNNYEDLTTTLAIKMGWNRSINYPEEHT